MASALADGKQEQLAGLDGLYPSLDALYQELHRLPELSNQEVKTAAKMAAQLRGLGFTVTEHVGAVVVGVLRNGSGPTVLVRTDMDALPIKEETGLPYASAVTAKDAAGVSVGVMHACGHDIHMASWVGAATLLSRAKDRWKGTLVFVGQPAEELVSGAEAMVKDGLLTRFPKPDFVVGIHDTQVTVGKVGLISGPASAASNAVDITFYGQEATARRTGRWTPWSSPRGRWSRSRRASRARSTRSTRRSSPWAPSTPAPSATSSPTRRSSS
jgi:hippurate hydrolase